MYISKARPISTLAANIGKSAQSSSNKLPNKNPNYHNLIVGIQGHLWSETITKTEYIDFMINPRLATLAEVAWSSNKRRGWREFKPALNQSMKILSKIGWKFHNF